MSLLASNQTNKVWFRDRPDSIKMSLGGLRKQFHKVNQYISETVGSAEPTKLDDVYNQMEKQVDTTNELINAFVGAVGEYLQPNPVTRAKKASVGALSRVSCEPKKVFYLQTEGMLATTLNTFGERLGPNNELGQSLIDVGEAFGNIADIKYQMEDMVKQNVFDPLSHLQNNELKTINQHRAKLKSRRLEYDSMRRSQRADDILVRSEEKLEESKRLSEMAMHNLLSNDVEQIAQLFAFLDTQLDYHRRTMEVLETAKSKLVKRIEDASSRPRYEHLPARVAVKRPSMSSLPTDCQEPTQNSDKPSHHQSLIDLDSPRNFPVMAPNGYPCAMPAFVYPAPMMPVFDQMKPTPLSLVNLASEADMNRVEPIGSQGTYWQQQPQNCAPLQAPLPESPSETPVVTNSELPCCRAIFDFQSTNLEDLDFKEGDIIELLRRIDDNWFEGRHDGRNGLFPSTYVQILVPLH